MVYDAEGFLVKNKDLLFQDMYEVMTASTESLTACMFPPLSKVRAVHLLAPTLPVLANFPPVTHHGTYICVQDARKKFSLGAQFRRQLNDLMKILNATQPHYIRCIKPNQVSLNCHPTAHHPSRLFAVENIRIGTQLCFHELTLLC